MKYWVKEQKVAVIVRTAQCSHRMDDQQSGAAHSVNFEPWEISIGIWQSRQLSGCLPRFPTNEFQCPRSTWYAFVGYLRCSGLTQRLPAYATSQTRLKSNVAPVFTQRKRSRVQFRPNSKSCSYRVVIRGSVEVPLRWARVVFIRWVIFGPVASVVRERWSFNLSYYNKIKCKATKLRFSCQNRSSRNEALHVSAHSKASGLATAISWDPVCNAWIYIWMCPDGILRSLSCHYCVESRAKTYRAHLTGSALNFNHQRSTALSPANTVQCMHRSDCYNFWTCCKRQDWTILWLCSVLRGFMPHDAIVQRAKVFFAINFLCARCYLITDTTTKYQKIVAKKYLRRNGLHFIQKCQDLPDSSGKHLWNS